MEIPLGPGGDPVAFRVGEGPASRLLGFEDNLTGVGHFSQSREAEGAAGNILDEPLDAFVVSGRQENRLIDAETGVPQVFDSRVGPDQVACLQRVVLDDKWLLPIQILIIFFMTKVTLDNGLSQGMLYFTKDKTKKVLVYISSFYF